MTQDKNVAGHPVVTKKLFAPLKIKSIEFKNRIWVSPMCQYSSVDGHPTDWHLVHLGSRAVGGAGLVMIEATSVSPEGRISPADSGLWSDEHIASFQKITSFISAQGAVSGVQLAHAGRKGSTAAPWLGGAVLAPSEGGWTTFAPSAVSFRRGGHAPRSMGREDLKKVINDFEFATERAHLAGFEVLELHLAHGYLAHEFLSPLSNFRDDEYGGPLEKRMRFPLEIVRAVRNKWPEHLPLFARISATDWADGADELRALSQPSSTPHVNENSWSIADALVFSRKLKDLGVDLIDCSSGGTLEHPDIPVGPGYQVPFAAAIKRETGILTAAVGMITEPVQAEAILHQHQADALFIAREFLRDPYWPARAARELGVTIDRPPQYGRA
jgi:2,4-dienoyl-CoA reductase-like NADH-dependent reductase (Old Yellow Enzyme family)